MIDGLKDCAQVIDYELNNIVKAAKYHYQVFRKGSNQYDAATSTKIAAVGLASATIVAYGAILAASFAADVIRFTAKAISLVVALFVPRKPITKGVIGVSLLVLGRDSLIVINRLKICRQSKFWVANGPRIVQAGIKNAAIKAQSYLGDIWKRATRSSDHNNSRQEGEPEQASHLAESEKSWWDCKEAESEQPGISIPVSAEELAFCVTRGTFILGTEEAMVLITGFIRANPDIFASLGFQITDAAWERNHGR